MRSTGCTQEIRSLRHRRFRLAPLVIGTISLAGVTLTTVPASAQDASDRAIVLGKRVGAVTKNITTAQLKKIYGAANVKAHKVPVGEGETVDGLIIYPGMPDELLVVWKVKDRQVEYVKIRRKGATWRTTSGIGMGTTAATLTRLNGGPFSITGFGWDYAGRIVNWRKGKLPKQLVLDMEATKKVSPNLERSVLGDKIFPSNNPVMLKKRLVVRAIFVGFD